MALDVDFIMVKLKLIGGASLKPFRYSICTPTFPSSRN